MKLAESPTLELPRKRAYHNQRGLKIEELAKQRLENDCPYSFYFREIDVECDDDTLVLQGRVSSFYMKQVLQTLLTNIDGVSRIDNQVDVTSVTGLSSVRRSDVKS